MSNRNELNFNDCHRFEASGTFTITDDGVACSIGLDHVTTHEGTEEIDGVISYDDALQIFDAPHSIALGSKPKDLQIYSEPLAAIFRPAKSGISVFVDGELYEICTEGGEHYLKLDNELLAEIPADECRRFAAAIREKAQPKAA